VGGAIAITTVGLNWGGWATASTAQDMAEAHATHEATLAMLPVCLNASAPDPEQAAKLMTIQ
jgi:hypothetical protein